MLFVNEFKNLRIERMNLITIYFFLIVNCKCDTTNKLNNYVIIINLFFDLINLFLINLIVGEFGD